MPGRLDPMLCTLIAAPFDDPAWIFEPKYDGLRVLAYFNGRELTLLSRNSPRNTSSSLTWWLRCRIA